MSNNDIMIWFGRHKFSASGPNGAPFNLALTVVGSDQINGAFESSATNADGYKLYKSTDNGATYSEHTNVTWDGLSFQAKGLTAETEYLFKVCAYKGNQSSIF